MKISLLRQTWYRWKALRLPWRKQFLMGLDLQGNTYWEFRDVRGDPGREAARWRRIVQFPRGTHPAAVQVSPQWHQWLRHTRHDPPSLAEQQHDVARQEQMRVLAAAADARWAGARSIEDRREQPPQTIGTQPEPQHLPQPPTQGNPGDKWQPESWTLR